MENYKYKVLKIDETKIEILEKILNNGWQIKATTVFQNDGHNKSYSIYILFKKEE